MTGRDTTTNPTTGAATPPAPPPPPPAAARPARPGSGGRFRFDAFDGPPAVIPGWAFDVLAIVFVLWLSFAQFGSQGWGEYADTATEPGGWGAFLIFFSAGALLWRRTAPWHAFAATIGLSLGLVGLGYAVTTPPAVAVMIYTIAARRDRGGAPIAVLITFSIAAYLALIAVGSSQLPLEPEAYVIPAAFWGGAFLFGDRRRTACIRRDEQAQYLEREEQLSVAEERARLARELHDSAGHAINTILVQAGAARVLAEKDPERSAEALRTVEEVARETVTDIDRIVGALRDEDDPADPDRAPIPTLDRIPALAERQRASGHEVTLEIERDPEAQIPHAVEQAGYRIAQETLTNAARYGTGATAMRIRCGTGAVEITVTNPIKRLVTQAGAEERPHGGRGIAGMRERAALLGGTLVAGPEGSADASGRIFRVHAVLPYDRRAA
jgi:signal transduction histidine kinase